MMCSELLWTVKSHPSDTECTDTVRRIALQARPLTSKRPPKDIREPERMITRTRVNVNAHSFAICDPIVSQAQDEVDTYHVNRNIQRHKPLKMALMMPP